MKKNIIIIIAAVIIAAGIGTGTFFVVRSRSKAPQPNTPEATTVSEASAETEASTQETAEKTAEGQKAETTTEKPTAGNTGKIEYSNIMTKTEFNKAYPICTNPVKSFSAGKYYAPIADKTGDGIMALRWGTDGKSVMVTTDEENCCYTFYKLNDYGEIIENGYYSISSTDSTKMDYLERASKFGYNDKHEIISYASSVNYTYDKDGNLTSTDTSEELLTYDSNRNIIKFYVSSNDYRSSHLETFRYKTNDLGLPIYVWTSVNGGAEDNGRSIEYTEVSKAQYDFYMSYLKAINCIRAGFME